MKSSKCEIELEPNCGFAITRRSLLAGGGVAGGLAFLGQTGAWVSGALAATQPTGQIVAGLSQEPVLFMPLAPHNDIEFALFYNLYSPLWRVDEKGDFQPDLVTEVPSIENGGISEDGLKWRLKLNPEAKWHDGMPFTAEDVKFNFELIQKPDFPAARRSGIELITDIEIVGPHELTFGLREPYAPFPSIISWTFLVPKHLIEKEDSPAQPRGFLASPVGTGPFKWSERVPGDHITLVANSDYHGSGPYVETLVLKYIPDMTVLFTQFQTGEIDYLGFQGITPDKYEEAQNLAQRVVTASPMPAIEVILFNLTHEALKELAVREALYLAIDKQGIIEQIYYNIPRGAESFLPRESWAYNADLPVHEYDPDKANRLLDDAGWMRGADGVREKNGVRLEFSNSSTSGNPVREQTQQLLQQNWLAIGAKMTIRNFPAAVIWGDYWNLSQFESVMASINFMVGPDPDPTRNFSSRSIPVKGGSGWNTGQYIEPEVDRLLDEGAATFDREKRKQAYLRLQEIIRRDLPNMPLFQYTMAEGVKEGLEGFTPNVNVMMNSWNTNTWYWAN